MFCLHQESLMLSIGGAISAYQWQQNLTVIKNISTFPVTKLCSDFLEMPDTWNILKFYHIYGKTTGKCKRSKLK